MGCLLFMKQAYSQNITQTDSISSGKVSVQRDSISVQKNTNPKIRRNSIYGELFGNGIIFSINYDRIFFIKDNKFSFRAGILYLFTDQFTDNLITSIEINYLRGTEHHLEMGIGATMFKALDNYTFIICLRPFGYRFQSGDKGRIHFRIAPLFLNPIIVGEDRFLLRNWLGISWGATL
jgi:hypothetical protein